MEKKYPFETMTVEEMADAMDKALEDVAEIPEEELVEQDVEYGYFEDD